MEGWIKLWRNMLEWEWQGDPNTWSVYTHLLLLARFNDGAWHGNTLEAGQVIIGRDKLATLCGLSVQQTRTALTHLVDSQKVTVKSTNKFTLVTLVNWDIEQGNAESSTSNQPADNQQINQQITSNQPQRNNGNNGEKKRKEAAVRCYAAAEAAGLSLTVMEKDNLDKCCMEYSEDWVIEAINRASDQGQVKISYIKAILKGFADHGGPDAKLQQACSCLQRSGMEDWDANTMT